MAATFSLNGKEDLSRFFAIFASNPQFAIREDLFLLFANQAALDFLGLASFSQDRLLFPKSLLGDFSFEDAVRFTLEKGFSIGYSFPKGTSHFSKQLVLAPMPAAAKDQRAVLCTIRPSEESAAHGDDRLSFSRLQAYAAHLETSWEKERSRFAKEIHDDLGQLLSCIGMDLSFLEKTFLSTNKDASSRIASLSQLVKDTIRTVRRISSDLHPSILDDLGLSAALDWLSNDFKTRSKIDCRVQIQGDPQLEPRLGIALFRLCQEVLNYIATKNQVSIIRIGISFPMQQVLLVIDDDGLVSSAASLDSQQETTLFPFRERVLLLGGHLEISPTPPSGTSFLIRLPQTFS